MNAPAHIRGHLSHAPLSLRAQRYDWVLEMHTLGFGFPEISAALGLGPSAASNILGRGDPRAPDHPRTRSSSCPPATTSPSAGLTA